MKTTNRKKHTTSRDLGLDHGGPGKGSASRITDLKAFATNFDQIDWKSSSRKVVTK